MWERCPSRGNSVLLVQCDLIELLNFFYHGRKDMEKSLDIRELLYFTGILIVMWHVLYRSNACVCSSFGSFVSALIPASSVHWNRFVNSCGWTKLTQVKYTVEIKRCKLSRSRSDFNSALRVAVRMPNGWSFIIDLNVICIVHDMVMTFLKSIQPLLIAIC